MADNYDFLAPTGTAPTGTEKKTARAFDTAQGLAQGAVLVHPTTGAALVGRAAAATSHPVALSDEDLAKLEAIRLLLAGSLTVGLPTGASTAANQAAAATLTGAVDETAPAGDTASSGLNGRLQRIAQRLTSLIGLLPGSLGQKARAASLAVTLSTEDVAALAPATTVTANLGTLGGAATAANQSAANASLSSIDGKLRAPRTLARAAISTGSSGDTTLVAAVTAQKVKVIAIHLQGAGDVNVTLKSGASTSLTGAVPLAVAGNGFVLPFAPVGEAWLETAAGEALVLNLSAAVNVRGVVVYVQEA